MVFYLDAFRGFEISSVQSFIKGMSWSKAIVLGAFLQLLLISGILLTSWKKRYNLSVLLLACDMVINTLICTPFFSVSSYSLPEVNNILKTTPNFPVQISPPSSVPANFIDPSGNDWQNVNVFAKEVSTHDSYKGPLVLKENIAAGVAAGRPLLYASTPGNDSAIRITVQRPTRIRATINLSATDTITLQQNYFTGWQALINNVRAPLIIRGRKMSLVVPQGRSVVEFVYRRKDIQFTVLFMHLFMLVTLLFNVILKMKGFKKHTVRGD
jgi:hypothetical protein